MIRNIVSHVKVHSMVYVIEEREALREAIFAGNKKSTSDTHTGTGSEYMN